MKVVFDTLEEIQSIFPLGSIVRQRKYTFLERYCNPDDIKALNRKGYIVKKKENGYEVTRAITEVVEGYIFNGKYWYAAYQDEDGWHQYLEDDFKEKEIRFEW